MDYLSVSHLLDKGSNYAESTVEVRGWSVDRFEHRVIYDSKELASERDPSKGIWLSGNLPKRKSSRGDGPLHGKFIHIRGKFHWQPNKKAGHMGLFSAWIGVKDLLIIEEK